MTVEDNTHIVEKGRKTLIPIRYFMAIMGCIGFASSYGFKVNVSVAIVAMVNHTAIKLSTSHDSEANSTVVAKAENVCGILNVTKVAVEDGPFVWDESVQGLILSAYFWGYMVSLLPGGRMAELLSAKWVMNGSVLLSIAMSLLTPIATQAHYSLFIVIRFIQGIGGGVSVPSLHVMIAKWAPPNERSFIASIVYAGSALGTVIFILLSGLLAANLGWESIFYVESVLCLIWCAAWWLLIEDSPEEQTRLISQEERNYIIKSLGQNKGDVHKKKLPVPWGQVFRSIPFLALLISHFCSTFGWYMMLIELPTFMSQILKFDLSSNATLSSMPFLCMWVFTIILSKTLTVIQNKNIISITTSRKIGSLFASLIPLLCLIGVSYAGCNRILTVVLMTIAVCSLGGMYCGVMTNHIDIAPNFAGTLVGITNSFATIPGLIVPIIVGKLTQGNQTIEAWRIVFFITIAMYIIQILVYTSFASGNEQPWNKIASSDKETLDQILPLKLRRESRVMRKNVTSNKYPCKKFATILGLFTCNHSPVLSHTHDLTEIHGSPVILKCGNGDMAVFQSNIGEFVQALQRIQCFRHVSEAKAFFSAMPTTPSF